MPRKWNILYQWINSLCFLSAASVRKWNIFYTSEFPFFVFKVEIASALFRMWNILYRWNTPFVIFVETASVLVRMWNVFHTNELALFGFYILYMKVATASLDFHQFKEAEETWMVGETTDLRKANCHAFSHFELPELDANLGDDRRSSNAPKNHFLYTTYKKHICMTQAPVSEKI